MTEEECTLMEKPESEITAFCFDCDGNICKNCPKHIEPNDSEKNKKLRGKIELIDSALRNRIHLYMNNKPMSIFKMIQAKYILEKELENGGK